MVTSTPSVPVRRRECSAQRRASGWLIAAETIDQLCELRGDDQEDLAIHALPSRVRAEFRQAVWDQEGFVEVDRGSPSTRTGWGDRECRYYECWIVHEGLPGGRLRRLIREDRGKRCGLALGSPSTGGSCDRAGQRETSRHAHREPRLSSTGERRGR